MTGLPNPAVGRVVHYRAPGSADGTFPAACRAATITEVGGWITDAVAGPDGPPAPGTLRTLTQRWDPEALTLHVTNPTGIFLNGPITHHEPAPDGTPPPGFTWHWPERV